MPVPLRRIIFMAAGAVVALFSYYIFAGWFTVIPWVIIAAIVGYCCNSKKDCIHNGAFFGFVLFLVYLFLGYKGKTDTGSMIRFTGFSFVLSLLGAVCGSIGAYFGYYLKSLLKKQRNTIGKS